MAVIDLFMPPVPVPFFWVTRYELDSRRYWFQYSYNDRNGFWFLSIGGESRVTQVNGVKLNIGTDKLRPYKYADVPQGTLDVVDLDTQTVEPRIADFGLRVVLKYTEPEEIVIPSRETFPDQAS